MNLLVGTVSHGVVVSAEPFTCKKDQYEFVLEFNENISFEEFCKAIYLLMEERPNYGYAKAKLYYRKPSEIYYRGRYRKVTQFECSFFIGAKSKELCYTWTRKTGYQVKYYLSWENIYKIEMISPNHPNNVKNQKKKEDQLWNRIVKNRFDEQTWSDLKPEHFRDGKHNFYYISKVFDEYDMQRIQKAFENKEEFHIVKRGKKRDFTATGRMCEDGIYRAWFSSEYSGCSNGDYYLLLNPKIAVFMEHD